MKNKIEINDANYEDIMAGLLEQHFSEEEKEELLFDIARDPFLQFEWKQFQKCVVKEDIQPYEIEEIEFWKSLQQKVDEKPVVKKPGKVIWFQFGIAASILLLAGILYLLLLPGEQNIAPSVLVKSDNGTNKILPEIKSDEKSISLNIPSKVIKTISSALLILKTAPVNEKLSDIQTEANDKIVMKESTPEKILSPQLKEQSRYKVHISSESISVEDFALLDDYDFQKISEEDLNRINNTLKNQQTTLAQLLKNTKVQFKQKDNKIYLMASGDHQSSYIIEIAN